MGSIIECFWMTPTELGQQSLRRYERRPIDRLDDVTCPKNRMRIHDVRIVLEGDIAYPMGDQGLTGEERLMPHEDPRWPPTCPSCGYVFREEDHWQHEVNRLFSGAPDGRLYTPRDMPPGAMYDANWWPNKGPDGIALAVVLPPDGGDNVWHPDSPSSSGGAWTRTGTIPKVTCSPSILTKRYHGWLRDGQLVEC